ncbi:hypothetical protein NOVOSPHI9U_100010 [Novosphingobium sp. 9U]|nr:hypothetical protein NOVOSPHI9U_100010 [Novosphingobium sp. 9U]
MGIGGDVSANIYLLDDRRSVVREDGKEITVPRVRAVAVLFLRSGRNAGRSTWAYTQGAFFRDGRTADLAVCKSRASGTVFYLKVLVGFVFSFGSRHFLVVENNTSEPFRYLDLDEARYGLMRGTLADFLKAMSPRSPLWKPLQRKVDSIIVQEVDEEYLDLATYTALSKGQDKGYNPPVGEYRWRITDTFPGPRDWCWEEVTSSKKTSLRWYNQALEALAEGRERFHGGG